MPSGISVSDRTCVLGRIHIDVSSKISKKKVVADNFINLYTYRKYDFIKLNVEERRFIHLGLVFIFDLSTPYYRN